MKVLVCGGRHYTDTNRIFTVLDKLNEEHGIDCVIEGAANGADRLAGAWARARGKGLCEFPADWETHGRSAGPIRNKQMLDEGKPDLVVAFPGGRGTANMVWQAKKAGVSVIKVPMNAAWGLQTETNRV